jgi:predicted  nucleic acid-binding Zn-ribbon protein
VLAIDTEMNATPSRDLERSIGRLEAGHDHIEDELKAIRQLLEKADERASDYRQTVRERLSSIDSKVDPLVNDIRAVKMTVDAHEAVLASYAKRVIEARGVGRFLRWVFHGAWMLGTSSALIAFADRIKAFMFGR